MIITLERKYRKEKYTIGRILIDGEYFCDSLEPTDRGLTSDMSSGEIAKVKIPGQTAIPIGKYRISMDIVSPRFSKKPVYEFCRGRLPRLVGVPGFDGVLIHIGNWADDTEGCILVGRNVRVGGLLYSTATFRRLYERILTAKEDLWIEIRE